MPAHDPGGLMATSIGRRPGPTTRLRVVEWNGDQHSLHEDRLTTEEPLAAGLLLSEGVVDTIDDVRTVAYCTDETLTTEQEFNVVTVSLARPPRATWDDQQMASTSACGVCGKDSLDAVAQMCTSDQRATATEPPSPDLLRSLPDRLREQQRVFDSTGGLHGGRPVQHRRGRARRPRGRRPPQRRRQGDRALPAQPHRRPWRPHVHERAPGLRDRPEGSIAPGAHTGRQV